MTQPGTNQILGGGGIHHVAFASGDFDKTVDFYTNLLGFKTWIARGTRPQRTILLDAGDGSYVEIFERPGHVPPKSEGAILHFALKTTRFDDVMQRVRAAGRPITMEPRGRYADPGPDPDKPWRVAFFSGYDGESIELFEVERA